MRTRITSAACALLCAAAVGACGGSSSSSASQPSTSGATSSSAATTGSGSAGTTPSAGSSPQIGFEGVPLEQGPLLAPASTTRPQSVDGISCDTREQLVYHIHARLTVFDDGRMYAVPAGVGIPGAVVQQTNVGTVVGQGKCFFWLHTHTTDGVIHIESPSRRIYTLGEFFDVWRQPLGPNMIARLHGKVTAFVNGKPWSRNPRAIPLLSHQDIQLEIGEPAPPIVTIDWSKTQL